MGSTQFTGQTPVKVWDVDLMDWVPMTQPGGSSGGGGDASAANQATEIARLTSLLAQFDVALSTRTKPADQQHVIVDSSASVAVTGPLTDTLLRASAVPVSLASVPSHAVTNAGTFPVQAARPTLAARTTVASVAADTALLAANAARFGSTVWNEADKTMYVALGTTAASLTNYTAQVSAGGYYETPFNYTGAVRAIWAANPTGNARITELT